MEKIVKGAKCSAFCWSENHFVDCYGNIIRCEKNVVVNLDSKQGRLTRCGNHCMQYTLKTPVQDLFCRDRGFFIEIYGIPDIHYQNLGPHIGTHYRVCDPRRKRTVLCKIVNPFGLTIADEINAVWKTEMIDHRTDEHDPRFFRNEYIYGDM
jgi:hypothetical protein